ncbi:hypothetical protein BDV19DRAFT_353440 [Aspergillus venezuelensis]
MSQSGRSRAGSVAGSVAGSAAVDPAFRTRLKSDMCRNIDLPYGAFSIDHLVSRRLSFARRTSAIFPCN